MRVFFSIVFFLLSSIALGESLRAIPKDFQGRWGSSEASCAEEYGVYVFKIENSLVTFWESAGKPSFIKVQDGMLELEL